VERAPQAGRLDESGQTLLVKVAAAVVAVPAEVKQREGVAHVGDVGVAGAVDLIDGDPDGDLRLRHLAGTEQLPEGHQQSQRLPIARALELTIYLPNGETHPREGGVDRQVVYRRKVWHVHALFHGRQPSRSAARAATPFAAAIAAGNREV
jgi:hypothetical protein